METVGGHKKGFKLLRSNSEAIAHKTRMGFNLIEAAIVLAVVGLVVGAIWSASANFYENYKVNKTVEGILFIVNNTRKLISYREAEAIGHLPVATTQGITEFLANAGAFPKDWVHTSGVYVQTNFGNSLKFGNRISPVPALQGIPVIEGALFDLTKSECAKIAVKLAATAGNVGWLTNGADGQQRYNMSKSLSGLVGMVIRDTGWTELAYVFPLSIEDATIRANPEQVEHLRRRICVRNQ